MHKPPANPFIKKSLQVAAIWAVCCLALSLNAADNTQPNFVFILGEGLGWTSTSVQLDPNFPESRSDLFP
ncbi:MAG: hypothetical protein ACYTGQ_15565, partial [Planctomycetota bacterium]